MNIHPGGRGLFMVDNSVSGWTGLRSLAGDPGMETGSGDTKREMNTLAMITPENFQVRGPDKPLRVVGIDLGTTNSAIAEVLMQPGDTGLPDVRCLEVEQETPQGTYTHTLVPSVVGFHDGKLLVGQGAKGLRTRLSDFDLERNRNLFWDCKNDMGVQRTYHKAPDGFQSARAIGGHLLRFLMDAARADDRTPITTTVVTTPASFQVAQRQDTVEAAELAAIELVNGGLLDEPVAAFIAYLVAHGKQAFAEVSTPRRLLVFDFGGGTCDVALFQLLPSKPGRPVRIAPLAVSRYHRLGGGDMDRTLVIDVLLPQLMEQNELSPNALDYGVKSNYVIPALLGVAESLKIGLCREIARLRKFGRYDKERATLVQKNPAVYPCSLGDGTELRLQSPTLSAVQWDKVLEPFLDQDFLYPRETDYHMTCSIFAPLQDALDRAGLAAGDVDLCLMVGGSSLIPQIGDAVEGFLGSARFLRFDSLEQTQTAVAQGGAWQALSLALYGQGIVHPVTSDSIGIRTSSGPVELIAGGIELPHPSAEGWADNHDLVVPETALSENVELRVELLNSDEQVLMSRIWTIAPIVNKGAPLRLRYRMDGNQVFHLGLALAAEPHGEEFSATVENPLTNVVNPNAKRDRILELEERMRTGSMTVASQRAAVREIATLEAELGKRERALHLLNTLNKHEPDVGILIRMGILTGEMGDYEQQEKIYREAARVAPHWNGPWFNLALSKWHQGKPEAAMRLVDEAMAIEPDPPSLVLKAVLAEKLGSPKGERDGLLERAFAAFKPLPLMDEFELFWYLRGVRLAGDGEREREAEKERRRRRRPVSPEPEGLLPGVDSGLVKRS